MANARVQNLGLGRARLRERVANQAYDGAAASGTPPWRHFPHCRASILDQTSGPKNLASVTLCEETVCVKLDTKLEISCQVCFSASENTHISQGVHRFRRGARRAFRWGIRGRWGRRGKQRLLQVKRSVLARRSGRRGGSSASPRTRQPPSDGALAGAGGSGCCEDPHPPQACPPDRVPLRHPILQVILAESRSIAPPPASVPDATAPDTGQSIEPVQVRRSRPLLAR